MTIARHRLAAMALVTGSLPGWLLPARPAVGANDPPAVQTPATTRATDAAELFLQASRAIVTDSPSSSALNYPAYPPMGDAWTAMAAQAWKANGKARDLARQARSSALATWPAGQNLHWLGECRELANDLVDASLYAHLQGQDAAAIELMRDNLHLARLMRKDPPTHDLVPQSVAAGIDAAGMYRLLMITSAIRLTADPADGQALQITSARQLIRELLDQQSSESQIRQCLGADYEAVKSDLGEAGTSIAKAAERFNRSNAERTMAAMSLACHLFRTDKGRWPTSLEEILATSLPGVPADPWGDGTQTFAYVLIKGGLPDGSDRPLVYSRCESQDGLFFQIDAPQYGFYASEKEKPLPERKRGGQFRDVARWVPVPGRRVWPTTQPLP